MSATKAVSGFQQSERRWNWFWTAMSLGIVLLAALTDLWSIAAIGGFLAGGFFTRATGFGMPEQSKEHQ